MISKLIPKAVQETVVEGLTSAGLAIWDHFQPPQPHPWTASPAPSDNLQRTMNLIMPLRRSHVLRRGELLRDLSASTELLTVGLNNVGTVHFARFLIVDRYLCMISVYDGEMSGYIRDFIGTIGQAFDVLMKYVKDPPPCPTSKYPDEFIAWVAAHDAFQFPDERTDLCPELGRLQREGLLVLRRNRHVQTGVYRCYPGYSAAQVRDSLEIGW